MEANNNINADIIIRQLEERDRAGIAAIAAVTYDGHDFVAECFDEYLKSPLCDAIVLDCGGRCIGLSVTRTRDDGKTGWLEGLRVHPDFRRQGLAKKILDASIDRNIKVDSFERLRYSLHDKNTPSFQLALGAGFQVASKMALISTNHVSNSVDEWLGKIQQERDENVKVSIEEIEAKDAADYMIKHGLGEAGTFQIDWKYFDVTKENFEYKKQHQQHMSILVGPQECPILSIGTDRPDYQGMSWSITVHGGDFQSVLAHIIHHVNIALKHNAVYIIAFADSCHFDALESKGLRGDAAGDHILLVERKL